MCVTVYDLKKLKPDTMRIDQMVEKVVRKLNILIHFSTQFRYIYFRRRNVYNWSLKYNWSCISMVFYLCADLWSFTLLYHICYTHIVYGVFVSFILTVFCFVVHRLLAVVTVSHLSFVHWIVHILCMCMKRMHMHIHCVVFNTYFPLCCPFHNCFFEHFAFPSVVRQTKAATKKLYKRKK